MTRPPRLKKATDQSEWVDSNLDEPDIAKLPTVRSWAIDLKRCMVMIEDVLGPYIDLAPLEDYRAKHLPEAKVSYWIMADLIRLLVTDNRIWATGNSDNLNPLSYFSVLIEFVKPQYAEAFKLLAQGNIVGQVMGFPPQFENQLDVLFTAITEPITAILDEEKWAIYHYLFLPSGTALIHRKCDWRAREYSRLKLFRPHD